MENEFNIPEHEGPSNSPELGTYIPYHTGRYTVDRIAFEKVMKDVESGVPLNMTMIGAIFGTPFWQLMVIKDIIRGGMVQVREGLVFHVDAIRALTPDRLFTYYGEYDLSIAEYETLLKLLPITNLPKT